MGETQRRMGRRVWAEMGGVPGRGPSMCKDYEGRTVLREREFGFLGGRGERGNDRVESRKVSLGTMREYFGCQVGKIYPAGNGVSEGSCRSNMARYEF